MMTRPSRWTRLLAAISQVLCVLFVDGDEDEMLSSYAHRTNNRGLIAWLDWLLGQGHCKESYEWERSHYNVERFTNAQ
jgi:hypothetical protein